MGLTISKLEVDTTLDWFEYVSSDSMHYGNGVGVFPFEKHLLDRLNACEDGQTVTLNESEIAIVYNWMRSAIDKNYGSEQYLTPVEKILHDKLVREMGKTDNKDNE